MKPSDLEEAIVAKEFSSSEKRLLKSARNSLPALICACIILFAVCYIWVMFYRYFMANPFFLIYNGIIYAAVVWAAFWSYSYERRVYRLLAKLIRKIDEQEAKKVISEIIDNQSYSNSKSYKNSTTVISKSTFFASVVLGFFLGIILVLLFNAVTKTRQGYPTSWDANGDGKKDIWAEYSNGKLVKYIYDQNFDGTADLWNYYENGLVVRNEYDMNRDGKVDYWRYFKKGEPFKYTADNDYDGDIDEWGFIESGIAKERNWSFRNDNIIDKQALYKHGRKLKEAYDRDRDGSFDKWVTLDEFERIVKVEKEKRGE